ncbi:HERC2 [Symbiodinium pilosum]|uniref:HERC2 protein n=1 Tax=Symbiodinium pilosum TaxID=2952 RepID=A0A812Q1E0_SYMPI|nr:HERC2 [Symbiodinium pilosum]
MRELMPACKMDIACHWVQAAKKDGDKKAKKASKKEAKKAKKDAKKEAKKAKKLAKQIKKLEEEVEKRKRQIKGEVQEKKKKKKSSSSSSLSSSAKRRFLQKQEAKKPPEPVIIPEEPEQQLPEQVLNLPERPCPQCGQEMQWSDLAEGDYTEDWLCDNFDDCRSSRTLSRTRWRWNCDRCRHDFCGACRGYPDGWRTPESEKSPPPVESSSEESDPEVHEGAVCDHCEMQPILGPRFKCASCEDVSLCKTCYKRRQEIHRPSHRFFAMKPMKSDLPATVPTKKVESQEKATKMKPMDKGKVEGVPTSPKKGSASGEPRSKPPERQRREPEISAPPEMVQPMIVPAVAQEVASQMQERLLNMGKGYAKSWQESVPTLQDPSAKKAAKAPKTESITKVGKQMKRGAACGLCLQQVLDSASGVHCFRIRSDGTEAGCSKAVCFPCMGRASARMFGKVRVNKEIWVAMGSEAWWMHEKCMTAEEVTEHSELVKSTGLEDSLKANAKLPKGWVSKISKTTGKVYYVNAKKGKTQWTLPEEEAEKEPPEPEPPQPETLEQTAETQKDDAAEDGAGVEQQEELTEL